MPKKEEKKKLTHFINAMQTLTSKITSNDIFFIAWTQTEPIHKNKQTKATIYLFTIYSNKHNVKIHKEIP